MKVLIVSRSPWNLTNSFGNTYCNFFDGIKDVQIMNVCLSEGNPTYRDYVTQYYQITEKGLIKSLFHKKISCLSYTNTDIKNKDVQLDSDLLENTATIKRIKTIRWQVFFWAREFLWKVSSIEKRSAIVEAVDAFSPDLIFQPLYYALYPDRLGLFFKKRYGVPMISEASIDVYTMKQFSLSPFFWINRLIIRPTVKRVIEQSQLVYLISNEQIRDYSKLFGDKFKLLQKAYCEETPEEHCFQKPYKLVYTGNIGDGRWKTLSLIGKALSATDTAHLYIYSKTPMSKKMKKAFDNTGVTLCGAISANEVANVQNEADILVHVESFNLKDKLAVRYSVSTKVVDYLGRKRCVLAVGPKGIASIEQLRREKAAFVIDSIDDIQNKTLQLVRNAELIRQLADNAFTYVTEKHSKTALTEMIYGDFKHAVESENGNKEAH